MYILFEHRHSKSKESVLAFIGLLVKTRKAPKFIHVAVYDEGTGIMSELALGGVYKSEGHPRLRSVTSIYTTRGFHPVDVPRGYPKFKHFILYLFGLHPCPCVDWVCRGFGIKSAQSPDDLFDRVLYGGL